MTSKQLERLQCHLRLAEQEHRPLAVVNADDLKAMLDAYDRYEAALRLLGYDDKAVDKLIAALGQRGGKR